MHREPGQCAVAESFKWRIGLGLELLQARGFYTIVIVATILGVALNFVPSTRSRFFSGALSSTASSLCLSWR